jgi:hypothetical protein
MNRMIKWTGILVGAGIIVTVGLAVLVFSYFSQANAQEASAETLNMRGPGFGPGGPQGDQQSLADALGISLADLQTAEQNASNAAIQQALDAGLITQDQADAMILRGRGFGFGMHFGADLSSKEPGKNAIDFDALLAKELGITTGELQTARQNAQDAQLAQAVTNGDITQEQADMIKARRALQSYLDPNALFAQALGLTTDELQSYRDQGLTLSQILEKAGKTASEVRDSEQAAYEAAIQKAVTDGVITQSQADQFLNGNFKGMGPGFGRGFHGGFGGFDGQSERPFKGGPRDNQQPQATPTAIPGGGV